VAERVRSDHQRSKSQRMWLGFSGDILAYQMRTLSDKRGGMTKGGILTRKENKDMGEGRRMPEGYIFRVHRRPAESASAVGRGVAVTRVGKLTRRSACLPKKKGISWKNPVDKEFPYPEEIWMTMCGDGR